MNGKLKFCLFFGLLGLFSGEAIAGNLITVGPGQQFADLPPAVAVAQSGDLIQVDPSGAPYSSIVIQGQGISILSSIPGQRYSIAATAQQPAIDVSSIQQGESVTIYEVDILYPDSTAPAIRVQASPGGVRFRDVQILPTSNLTTGPSAMIEVDHSQSVWLSQVVAHGNRIGVNASGNGVHGLLLRNSGALVQSSSFTAFDSISGSGGNGIELDQSRLWTTAIALGSTQIAGGNGATGGHGIFLTNGNTSQALGCERDLVTRVILQGGTGTSFAQHGHEYWFPGGSGSSPGLQWSPVLARCVGDAGIVYSSVPNQVSIGTTATFTLEAEELATSSVGLHGVALGTPFINWLQTSPNGFLSWDFGSVHGQAGGGTYLPSVGAWPAYRQTIPNNPGLIGYQLSVQGWIISPVAISLGEPRMLVIVP